MKMNFSSNPPVKFNGGGTGTVGGTASPRNREELTQHVWKELGDRFDSALENVDESLSGGNPKYNSWTDKKLEKYKSARNLIDNMTRLAAANTSPFNPNN